MHPVDGVIANGPGPLNLVYRCGLEETGQLPAGITCTLLSSTYGTTQQNPDAYAQRSLLNFTEGHLSKILFVQGLEDSSIQMYSWPTFRAAMEACTDCAERTFVEVPDLGHQALFNSPVAKEAFNAFIGM
ncbi:MAG TPA: hypothetical protein PKN30_10700 [Flavobacteriales bacterium]|nr:hypothetical protein [Flavobacteriales bacterium]